MQVVISTPAVDFLHSKDCTFNITLAILKQSDKLISSLLVEDIDLIAEKLNRSDADIDQVNNTYKHLLNGNGYIKVTGSTIRIDKSFLHLINFQFKANREFVFLLAS